MLRGGESGSRKGVGIDGGQPLCEVVAMMDGHGTCMLACMIRNHDRKPLTEEKSDHTEILSVCLGVCVNMNLVCTDRP
jgi:hypothetical protein